MRPLAPFFAALLLSGATTYGALYYSGTLDTVIPDGNPNGISSSINVSGMGASVYDVSVSVNLSGGYNGDLYAYLSYGNGSVVLLNRIGKTSTDPFGSSSSGMLVTFSDSALTDIHSFSGGSPITGTYQPDCRTDDPQIVLDTSARGPSLSSLNGPNVNGNWTIFFADMASGGGSGPSTLMSWGLDVTPVPEPANMALGILAGLFVLFATIRSRRVRAWISRSRSAFSRWVDAA